MSAPLLVAKEKLAKPPLAIHTLGDRVLRSPSKNIATINAEIRALAKEMLQTMYSSEGIGLAAPQVGVNKRMMVIDTDPEEPANPVWVMVNPVIKRITQDTEVGQEGCLSVPGIFADVIRPARVVVSFRDMSGKPQVIEAGDLLARVILHEMDHLEGVLFVDRVENQLTLAQDLTKRGFSPREVQQVR